MGYVKKRKYKIKTVYNETSEPIQINAEKPFILLHRAPAGVGVLPLFPPDILRLIQANEGLTKYRSQVVGSQYALECLNGGVDIQSLEIPEGEYVIPVGVFFHILEVAD